MTYTWTWVDGENDEADREWIEITDPDGEEFATIMHRKTNNPDSPKWKGDKEARAALIVDALNAAEPPQTDDDPTIEAWRCAQCGGPMDQVGLEIDVKTCATCAGPPWPDELEGDHCDCRDRGWYVIASDGDDSHDWVERCDDCRRFDTDDDAAEAAAEATGRTVAHAPLHEGTEDQSLSPRPYLI